jgi:phosphoribosylformimino-5-aminoimidazole carboxamide ribotide isomerase
VEVSSKKAFDLARELEALGASRFIFTDISRDGMLEGPNLKSVKEFAKNVNVPVIASGGVGNLKHIEDLMALEGDGVAGVIVGKALYDHTITFQDAVNLTRKQEN